MIPAKLLIAKCAVIAQKYIDTAIRHRIMKRVQEFHVSSIRKSNHSPEVSIRLGEVQSVCMLLLTGKIDLCVLALFYLVDMYSMCNLWFRIG